MGWCQEFGPQLREDCAHPMAAGRSSCQCTACGLTCTGRFAGCGEVWARAEVSPATPLPEPQLPLGDVRHALDAIRAEIEELRTTDEEPPPPPPPPLAEPLPSYDELLDLTVHRRRGGRWWKRHRAQHLER